ncbi:MAG TPA: hypothetical protein VFZ43_08690 [Anaerolineales bacterium]
MTKFDSASPSLTYPTAWPFDGERYYRLMVLVPADADYTAATRRIWELAITTGMHVQLLGLCKDVGLEPSLRRQLVTMSALMGNGKVSTEVKVEIGANWVEVVKRHYQTGDMIVCFAEQRAELLHRPLNQMLEANLDAPVYILSGLYTREYSGLSWASEAIAWIGSIGIIVGFFLFQSRIALVPTDWIQTSLLILIVIFEFWLILVWNNLFD